MSDQQSPSDLPIGDVDAAGEPSDVAELIHPEQPPMDDAAGPQQSEEIETVATDDLTVQGGE